MLIGMGLMKLGFFTGRALLCQLLVESYQLMYGEFSAAVRSSEAVPLGEPVVPVFDSLSR
jgi:hypothetical protein